MDSGREDVSAAAVTMGLATPREGGPVDDLQVGSCLGRYVVLEQVGEGGMGRVLRAYDPRLRREVALKLLHKFDDPKAHADMLREARAMAQLSHPNLVPVYDVDEYAGRPFIAMEYIEGKTLKAWLGDQLRSWRRIVEVFTAAGHGLAAAHAIGLVHRDFKPSNVVMGHDGRPRVLDFGLARGADRVAGEPFVDLPEDFTSSSGSLSDPLTHAGTVVGTPAYMAPEQHDGAPPDPRSDQYSFCLCLWEALHGERPFKAKAQALVQEKRAGRLPEGSATRSVPRWIARILEQGLAPAPADRHASMDSMLAALGRDPTRRRLWGVGAASVVAMSGALFGVHRLDEARRRAACADEGAEIAEVWSEDSRQALHEGLMASGSSHAQATFDRLVPWLDRYAEDWRRATEATCVATSVADSRDPEIHRRAVECLDEHRAAFTALVESLVGAEADVVERAISSAANLEPIATCEDEGALRARVYPDDEAKRTEIADLRERLYEVDAYERIGDVERGLKQSRELVEQADALGYDPVRAEARVRLGKHLKLDAAYEEAERTLDDAFWLALGSGHDVVAADVAIVQVFFVGDVLDRKEDAMHWARMGETLLQRLGQGEGIRGASLSGSIASVHSAFGDFEEAKRRFEESLEIQRRLLGDDHPSLLQAEYNYAVLRVSLGQYDEALKLFERVFEAEKRVLGPEHPNLGKVLNNIGATHAVQGHYEEAIPYFERALELQQRLLGPEHPRHSEQLNNLAAANAYLGNYVDAKKYFQRAIEMRQRALGSEHPDIAKLQRNLSTVQRKIGNYEQAKRLAEHALATLERELGPEHPNVAGTLNELGLLYLDLDRADDARRCHERALQLRESLVGDEHKDVGQSLSNLAEVYAHEGEYDEALRLYTRALEVFERALGPDNAEVAFPLAGIGMVRMAQGSPEEALEPLERAWRLREGGDVEPGLRSETRFALARALWESDTDRARARRLAEAAAQDYRRIHPAFADEAAELERWLSRRRGR